TGDGSGSINVFPNPTDGMLNITGLAEDAILTVMNLQGRELWVERQKAEGLLTLKMANHKPGIYFIKIQQNEETIFRKVVLK
ncbi:MAG: T9SS type A sorting domain-containing protein, partial [Bacteroidales bacterium]|nr:T9SS type A sorting domain-containing protein [Bacteroidales bacterium]